MKTAIACLNNDVACSCPEEEMYKNLVERLKNAADIIESTHEKIKIKLNAA